MKYLSTFSLFILLIMLHLKVKAQVNYAILAESYEALPADSFYNGSDGAGQFSLDALTFPNSYDSTWGSWSGFALSSTSDTSTPGYINQYSSVTGSGFAGSDQYVVAFLSNDTSTIRIDTTKYPDGLQSFFIANTYYAYHSMKNGDQFADPFGGNTGNEPDSMIFKASGYSGGNVIDTTSFALADYRFSDNSKDTIMEGWNRIYLEAVDSVKIWLEVSQSATPAYVAMDFFEMRNGSNGSPFAINADTFFNGQLNSYGFSYFNGGVHYAYENDLDTGFGTRYWTGFATSTILDSTTRGFANQYSPIDSLAGNLDPYLIANGSPSLFLSQYDSSLSPEDSLDFMINNTTYAYWAMKAGTSFGDSTGFGDTLDCAGDCKDFFKVNIITYHKDGFALDTIEHYLADFRSNDSSQHFIQRDWQSISLPVQNAHRIQFIFEGSDTGSYGLNTPKYLAMSVPDEIMSTKPLAQTQADQLHAWFHKGMLYYEIEKSAPSSQRLQLYDMQGREVWRQDIGRQSKGRTYLQDLPAGVYILHAESQGAYIGKQKLWIY